VPTTVVSPFRADLFHRLIHRLSYDVHTHDVTRSFRHGHPSPTNGWNCQAWGCSNKAKLDQHNSFTVSVSTNKRTDIIDRITRRTGFNSNTQNYRFIILSLSPTKAYLEQPHCITVRWVVTGKEVEWFTLSLWPWLTQLEHAHEPLAQEQLFWPAEPQWLMEDFSIK
jgi:hypothetical protein